MTNFIVGDVVRLKSGGPRMTIYSIEGIGIICQWFITIKGNQVLSNGMFQPEQLLKFEEESEPRRVHNSFR